MNASGQAGTEEPIALAPVAILIFNRPHTTERVFAAIREAGPSRLLVVADGPRRGRAGEDEACAAARAITERVDWPCEVSRNYSEENLGCRRRMSSGLDWVFQTVPEAIILEDDILPHPTFFRFCTELLERYRDDTRVAMISGDGYPAMPDCREHSYYFSRFMRIWGWATWRRSWTHYDVNIRAWPDLRRSGWLEDVLGERRHVRQWTRLFDKAYENRVDTWDYQWNFSSWLAGGLAIAPSVNLTSNIGFGLGATHTTKPDPRADAPTEAIRFPLRHPPYVLRTKRTDEDIFNTIFGPPKKPWLMRKLARLGLGRRATKKTSAPTEDRNTGNPPGTPSHAHGMRSWALEENVIRPRDRGGMLKLHVGCGPRVLKGWVNIDLRFEPFEKYLQYYGDEFYGPEVRGTSADFLALDVTGGPLPCSDNSVDLIFHEDFLEHLDQRQAVIFLAECYRVLKPGGVHRVNTPDLAWTLRGLRTTINQGGRAVCQDEWLRWHHQNLQTKRYLEDVAGLIGYRVVFQRRDQSLSPDLPREYRPGRDRSEAGNIFADLVKPLRARTGSVDPVAGNDRSVPGSEDVDR